MGDGELQGDGDGKRYTVNEIFYSIQGEGVRAGTANVFVRFSGCNQTCKVETHGFDCDTEFASGRKLTALEIVQEAQRLSHDCSWLVLTGGEPGLQMDDAMLTTFRNEGYSIAVETNGSVALNAALLDWITVSPKVAEHAIRQKTAHEVKYVRGYGQAIPKTVVEAPNRLISPAFRGLDTDTEALHWCIQLVKDNPAWRLSCQQHKWLNVR